MRGLNNIPGLLNRNDKTEKVGNFVINDIELHVPPTAISVHKEGLHYSMKALRTKSTTKILSGSGVYHAQVKITFPQDSLISLHRLICEIKNSPFVSIKNHFISDSIGRDLPGYGEASVRSESFTVMGLQVTNHPSSPNAFLCELDLRLFNHKPYTRLFGYRKEFLNKVNDEYFTHSVLSFDPEASKKIKLNFREKEFSKRRSVRSIVSNIINGGKFNYINNPQSNIYVEDARKSNAYKRYANYLQAKSLFDNFGLEIKKTSSEDKSFRIGLSENLYNCFEGGYSRNNGFPEVYGLHEIIKADERLFKESIKFRSVLTEFLLKSSTTVSISYKEFYKYTGDADFMRRYENSLNQGIGPGQNLTQGQKAEIRKSNLDKIQKAFSDGKAAVSSGNEDSSQTYLSFIQPEEDRVNSDNLYSPYTSLSSHEYYPITSKAIYREQSTDHFVVFSESNLVQPIYSPIDGSITYSDTKIVISNDRDSFVFYFKTNEGLELFSEDYDAPRGSVEKGQLIRFVAERQTFEIGSNVNLVEVYKSLEAAKTIATGRENKKLFGELTEEDREEFNKLDRFLSREGYKLNTTRATSQLVFERTVTHDYGLVTTDEAIEKFLGKNQTNVILPEKPTVITNLSANIRHIMASIPIVGLEHPTHQFLGSIEPNYQMSFIGRVAAGVSGGMPEALKELESIRQLMQFNAKNFAFIPDSGNIYVSSFITKLFGSEIALDNVEDEEIPQNNRFFPNIVISSTDSFTVEGSPGVSGMHVRFSESKSYTEERLGSAKTTQIKEDVYREVLESYRIGSGEPGETNLDFATTSFDQSAEYIHLKKWKTKSFTSEQWYKYGTVKGKKYARVFATEKEKALDNNGYKFVAEYLQPLQDFLDQYAIAKGSKPLKIKFKYGGTFDDARGSHRDTLSNHFGNVAADIYVQNMNAMELASIIYHLTKAGYLNGKELRGNKHIEKSLRNVGLGIYGSDADDFNTLMNGKNSNGFIHIDANFSVVKNTNSSGEIVGSTATPRNDKWRVWVGDKDAAAFRIGLLTKTATSKRFWGWGGISYDDSTVKEIYESIISYVSKAFTALSRISGSAGGAPDISDETIGELDNENDSTETEKETISGKQDSVKYKDSLGVLAAKLDIPEDSVQNLSTEDLQEYKELLKEKGAKVIDDGNYSYVRINSSSISADGPRGPVSNRLALIKEKLKNTSYLTINEEADFFFERNYLVVGIPNQKKRISKTSDMLNAFQLLASTILTEPYLYTKDIEEAKNELKRINNYLGVDVIPHLYNTLEGGLLGTSHLISLINETSKQIIENEDLGTLGKIEGAALGGSLAAGTAAKLYVGNVAYSLAAPAAAAVSVPIVSLVLIGLGLGYAAYSVFAKEEEENWQLQSERVIRFIEKFKNDNSRELFFKSYIENIKSLENYYRDKRFESNFDSSNFDIVLTKLGDARTVSQGVDNYLKLIFTKLGAFKYFEEIAENLATDSTLRNLINYQAAELSKEDDPKKFLGSSLILGNGNVRDYLMFLFEFTARFDSLYFDMLNPDETQANDIFYIERTDNKLKLVDGIDNDFYYPSSNLKLNQKETLFKKQVLGQDIGFKESFFTEQRRESIKLNQEEKLKWLKGILTSLLESNLFLDENPEVEKLRYRLENSLNIFDSETYPDITVPNNPMFSLYDRKLDPSFYYWSNKELNVAEKARINKRDEANKRKIIENSLAFEKAITSGLYTGPKRLLEEAKSKELTESNEDITLLKLNEYTFKDSVDAGIEREISAERYKEIVGSNISLGAGSDIKALRESYDSLVLEMTSNGKVSIGEEKETNGFKNNLGLGNVEDFLSLSEDAYENFYSDDDMIQAYPTFKLYLIEEDEEISDRLIAFDDFHYYNSVIAFNYTNTRELPAQTATIQLQNISGTLDGTKRGELRDIDIERDTRKTPYASDDNIAVDGIVLRPGINVQLRAGYGAHSKDLSVLINGRVTEVNYSSDNMTANITVQSFGYELDSKLKNSYAEGVNFTYETTSEVLASLVYSEELKHFGKIKKGKIFPFDQSGNQKVLDIENYNEDTSYAYALFKGSLDFFERNATSIAIGLIALEFVGPLAKIVRFKIPAVDKVTTTVLDKIGKVQILAKPVALGADATAAAKALQIAKNVGYYGKKAAIAPARFTYERLNTLVGRNLYGRLFAEGAASNGTFLTGIQRQREFLKAIRAGKSIDEIAEAAALSRYEVRRALGLGPTTSFLQASSNKYLNHLGNLIKVPQVSAQIANDITFKVVAQTKGHQIALRYARSVGFNPGFNLSTYSRLLTGASPTGGISVFNLFFNQFNVIPKTGAIVVGAATATILMSLIGAGLGGLTYPFSNSEDEEFQKRKERLKKRIVLSPTDDNLFPPEASTYIAEKSEGSSFIKEFFESLFNTASKSLFIGFNLASTTLLKNGNDDKPPSIKKIIKSNIELSTKMLKRGSENLFYVSNQSIWDVLKELTYRHPGYVYGIRPYGEKFEYRIFFGKPDYRYYADYITNSESTRLNRIRQALSNKDGLLSSSDQKMLYPDLSEGDFSQEEITQVAYEEFIRKTKKRFTPFRKYHSVDSHRNLVANNIVTSGHNVINTVQVHTVMSDDAKVGENNKDDVYTVTLKASQNIPRELEKAKTLQMENIRGVGNANRYGISELIYSSKEMYTGSVLVLGNDKINPWDVIIFNDKITNMYGPLEVKAVTHMFSHETGFLTDIEVNAVVTANDFFSMPMLQQSFLYEARKYIFENYRNRRELGLTGDTIKDKEIIKNSLVDAIENMSNEERGILESTISASGLINNPGSQGLFGIGKAISGLFSSSRNKETETVLNRLTEELYKSYSNPESINFAEDVVSPYGTEITSEIGELASSLEAGVGATGVGLGAIVMAKNTYSSTVNGLTKIGSRSKLGALVSAGLILDSYTTKLFEGATGRLSRYFYDSYLEENLAKPFILAKTTEESVIRIAPLIKDGKPLLSGGFEKVSEQEKWNQVYGNFYNNMSDGYRGYLREKKRLHAEGARVIDNLAFYEWIKPSNYKIAATKLIGGNSLVGYFHGEEEE